MWLHPVPLSIYIQEISQALPVIKNIGWVCRWRTIERLLLYETRLQHSAGAIPQENSWGRLEESLKTYLMKTVMKCSRCLYPILNCSEVACKKNKLNMNRIWSKSAKRLCYGIEEDLSFRHMVLLKLICRCCFPLAMCRKRWAGCQARKNTSSTLSSCERAGRSPYVLWIFVGEIVSLRWDT